MRAGCAYEKMEPKGCRCHSCSHLHAPHCSKSHFPAAKRSRVYCDWVLMWHQIYLWLLRQSIQLVTPVSPLKYKPHRSSLPSHTFSQGFLCSAYHLSCSSCPSQSCPLCPLELQCPLPQQVALCTATPPSPSVKWILALPRSSTS